MTLVPSLEEKKDQLNAAVFPPSLICPGVGEAGWPGRLLLKLARIPASQHEMQMGSSYKARGCFLGFPLRGVCLRPGLEEGGSRGNGALCMVAPHCLQTQCYNGREGSGPLDSIPVAAVDASPKNQSFCRVCGKLPK